MQKIIFSSIVVVVVAVAVVLVECHVRHFNEYSILFRLVRRRACRVIRKERIRAKFLEEISKKRENSNSNH